VGATLGAPSGSVNRQSGKKHVPKRDFRDIFFPFGIACRHFREAVALFRLCRRGAAAQATGPREAGMRQNRAGERWFAAPVPVPRGRGRRKLRFVTAAARLVFSKNPFAMKRLANNAQLLICQLE
jgi:hypothetical protein